jgi:hypothetical protein
MLPGQIYSQSGKVLEFQIEKAHRSGAVSAYDPSTGERFSGRYVGIRETIQGSDSIFVQSGPRSAVGYGSKEISSNIGNATAFLSGDKGSSLNCTMQIEIGFNPHGLGTCMDAKGDQYRVQF